MTFCEQNGVDYIFALAGTKPLARKVDEVCDAVRTERAVENKTPTSNLIAALDDLPDGDADDRVRRRRPPPPREPAGLGVRRDG
jgi:hypothetical protein